MEPPYHIRLVRGSACCGTARPRDVCEQASQRAHLRRWAGGLPLSHLAQDRPAPAADGVKSEIPVPRAVRSLNDPAAPAARPKSPPLCIRLSIKSSLYHPFRVVSHNDQEYKKAYDGKVFGPGTQYF